MEEMRLDNDPAEATLDQTITLNSVIQPRTHANAATCTKHASAKGGSISRVHTEDKFVPI